MIENIIIKSLKSIFAILAIVFAFTSYQSQATHLRGGEITWRCAPNGGWIFTFRVYSDCGGAVSINQNANTQILRLENYPTTGATLNMTATRLPGLAGTRDISPQCFNPAWSWRCNATGTPPFTGGAICPPQFTPCTWNGQSFGAVAEFVWETQPIMLTGTPPAAGWNVRWNECCRNNSVNVTGASGQQGWFRSTMYAKPNPAGGSFNASTCYDNSPVFLEPPVAAICVGDTYTYSPLAGDPDLDPIEYSFATGLGSNGNPLNFAAGYSATSPFPSGSPNGPTTINPITGNITVIQLNNTNEGNYLLVVKVSSYCAGVLIAEVYRDIQVSLVNCTKIPGNNLVNSAPVISLSPLNSTPYTFIGNDIEVDVIAGDTIWFNMVAEDFDFLPNFLPQSIKFEAVGDQVGANFTSETNCATPPCATMIPFGGQTGYTNFAVNRITFRWITDCAHLASGGSNCSPALTNEYFFTLKMTDNYCPVPAVSITNVRVKVNRSPDSPPSIQCITADPSGGYNIQWTAPSDTGYNFNYYVIFSSPGPNGPFTPIDTIFGYNNTSFTTPVLPPGVNWFQVGANMGCNFISLSDTAGALNLNLVASPPPGAPLGAGNEIAELTWNIPIVGYTGDYEVHQETPTGSNNWTLLATTPDTFYTDMINACGVDVAFQVKLPASGLAVCVTSSNEPSEFFSDETNNDTLVVEAASVLPSGEVELSWMPTTEGDVIKYYIMKLDVPSSNWLIIDSVDVPNTSYVTTGSNAPAEIEYYKVISIDSCGNISNDVVVQEHNTLRLTTFVSVCEGTNRIIWNPYEAWESTGELAGYAIYADIIGPGGTTPNVLIYSGGPNDTVFVQSTFEPESEYCYVVEAMYIDSTRSARSHPVCVNPGVPNKSQILYIAYADVELDGIKTEIFYDGGADIKEIKLLRANAPQGPYYLLNSFPKANNPPFVHSFTDFNVDVRQRYYYRAETVDSCDARDTISNIASNIVLRGKAERNDRNQIFWTPYIQFDGFVSEYEIYRGEAMDGSFALQPETALGTDTIFFDNIRDLAAENNVFCYFVRAIEISNGQAIPPGFGPFTARSNRICVTHEAKVFIPNAFRPGSPNPENRKFGVKSNYIDEARFNMKIFNRWGQLVFETNDPTEGWDGTYQGSEAPTGVYMYVLNYATKNGGLIQDERGNVTLIR